MAASGPPRVVLPRLTDRLPLGGGDGLSVSPACLGIVDSPETVVRAFETGINFFFVTVDMHWPLYDALRRGLRSLLAEGSVDRDRIVVAAVSYLAQPEFGWMPFTELLAAVPELEYLDVLVVGGAYQSDVGARLERRREQVAGGFLGARAVGVTLHERHAAVSIANDGLADIAFVRYNPAHTGAREDTFSHLRASRTLLFNFNSLSHVVTEAHRGALGLDQRFWLPRPSDYYRFALSRSELDGILCAPGTPDEVTSLRDALEQGPLTEDEARHLVRLADLSLGRQRLRRRPDEPPAGNFSDG